MEQAIFTLKNNNGKPVGTIFIQESKRRNSVMYGLSLKSKQDKFNARIGINLAKERARRNRLRNDSHITRKEAFNNLQELCPKDFNRIMRLFTVAFGFAKHGLVFTGYRKAVSIFCD